MSSHTRVPTKHINKILEVIAELVAIPYDILMQNNLVDEIDYSWSLGRLTTEVYMKGGARVLTLTYTWNPDGTLQKVVRT